MRDRDSHWAATKGVKARRSGAEWTAFFFSPLLDGDGRSGGLSFRIEMEDAAEGLQLVTDGAEDYGVFPTGVEEREEVGDEVDLEVEQPLAEGVYVLAGVYGEDEGVAPRDTHEGVLHELQVVSKWILFHDDLILNDNEKERRRTSCSSPSG